MSPGSLDMKLVLFAQLWYLPYGRKSEIELKIQESHTAWHALRWCRKVVTSSTMLLLPPLDILNQLTWQNFNTRTHGHSLHVQYFFDFPFTSLMTAVQKKWSTSCRLSSCEDALSLTDWISTSTSKLLASVACGFPRVALLFLPKRMPKSIYVGEQTFAI